MSDESSISFVPFPCEIFETWNWEAAWMVPKVQALKTHYNHSHGTSLTTRETGPTSTTCYHYITQLDLTKTSSTPFLSGIVSERLSEAQGHFYDTKCIMHQWDYHKHACFSTFFLYEVIKPWGRYCIPSIVKRTNITVLIKVLKWDRPDRMSY